MLSTAASGEGPDTTWARACSGDSETLKPLSDDELAPPVRRTALDPTRLVLLISMGVHHPIATGHIRPSWLRHR
jgi:hypothetical protein